MTDINGRPAFDIQQFKSYLGRTGYLPASRYYLEITTPDILKQSGGLIFAGQQFDARAFERDISFRAEALSAPGISISYDNINRYGVGPNQKFPYNAQFTDMSVTFLADKESLLWSFFYAWLNNIFQYSSADNGNGDFTSYRANYMKDYATNISINIFDVDGSPSMFIKLVDAYPISMNEVRLAWDSTNQTMKITVTFTFRHWLMEQVTVKNKPSQAPTVSTLYIPKTIRTVAGANTIVR
jgi:hypothetical protein